MVEEQGIWILWWWHRYGESGRVTGKLDSTVVLWGLWWLKWNGDNGYGISVDGDGVGGLMMEMVV